MKRSTSTILGFILAPLVPVIVMGVINPPIGGRDLVTYFVIAAIFYVNAATFMAIFGAPTYFLFKKWGVMRWWSVALVGFLIGALVAAVFRLPFYPSRALSMSVHGCACAVSGMVFWLIWRLGEVPTEPAA